MDEQHEDDVPRDLAKLWTWAQKSVAEIEGQLARISDALWGRNMDNGLHGRTKAIELDLIEVKKEVRDGISWGNKMWEVERHKPGMCIGKNALDEYLNTKKKESEETRKIRWALYGGILVALISAGTSLWVANMNQETQLRIAEINRDIKTMEARALPGGTK
jgi:hypothetical protein